MHSMTRIDSMHNNFVIRDMYDFMEMFAPRLNRKTVAAGMGPKGRVAREAV